MAKQSAELNLGYIFTPLGVSSGIEVLGNVTPDQVYDSATGVYSPDYTSSFLQLRGWLEADDPDGILTAADKVLTNVRWYIVENRVEKQLTGSSEYVIDGTLLTVKRNFSAQVGATFRMEADFLDPRTGEIWQIAETQTITCESVSTPPKLTLDCVPVIRYDPVRDKYPKKKIKATLKIGEQEVAAANRAFVWQKKDCDIDNVWADIDGSDIMDYDVSLSSDGSELTVDCELIGNRIDLRCYAKCNPYGSAAGLAIDAKTPMQEVTVRRVKKSLRGVVLGARLIKKGQKYVYPEVRVYDGRYEIENPESVLDIQWRRSVGNKNGTVVKSAVIAYGQKPAIAVTDIDTKFGGKIIAEFSVKTPLRAMTSTANGPVIVDGDGSIILVRKND